MRRSLWPLAAMLALLLVAWAFALSYEERRSEPVHNAYWPFTVELSVKDR